MTDGSQDSSLPQKLSDNQEKGIFSLFNKMVNYWHDPKAKISDFPSDLAPMLNRDLMYFEKEYKGTEHRNNYILSLFNYLLGHPTYFELDLAVAQQPEFLKRMNGLIENRILVEKAKNEKTDLLPKFEGKEQGKQKPVQKTTYEDIILQADKTYLHGVTKEEVEKTITISREMFAIYQKYYNNIIIFEKLTGTDPLETALSAIRKIDGYVSLGLMPRGEEIDRLRNQVYNYRKGYDNLVFKTKKMTDDIVKMFDLAIQFVRIFPDADFMAYVKDVMAEMKRKMRDVEEEYKIDEKVI